MILSFTKCYQHISYLMPKRGRERNPCSASLVLVFPSSCARCCKRAGYHLALTLLCSRAAGLSQSLWGQEGPRCAMKKPHAFVLSQIRSCLLWYSAKSSSIDSTWVQTEWNRLPYDPTCHIVHLKVEQGWHFGQNVVKRRLDFGCSCARRWFCVSGVDRVLTHMAATSLRWLQTLLKTGCLPCPSTTEPFRTMPGQLLSSGSGPQRCCPPPALPSWISGKLKFVDGRRANLCHSTWDIPKSWNTIWYCFYSLWLKKKNRSHVFFLCNFKMSIIHNPRTNLAYIWATSGRVCGSWV